MCESEKSRNTNNSLQAKEQPLIPQELDPVNVELSTLSSIVSSIIFLPKYKNATLLIKYPYYQDAITPEQTAVIRTADTESIIDFIQNKVFDISFSDQIELVFNEDTTENTLGHA